MSLKGAKVLVTGGTGFIGGRLVDHLVLDQGAEVRVLVKNFARAPRIARLPIRMLPGEVTDLKAVTKAVEGCEVVFHCAYGNEGSPQEQKKVTVEGTENVLNAALNQKVNRVVHVSTISVYGKTPDGEMDESAPRRRSNDVYADSKLEAEELALKYYREKGLPVSIIQPTIVYGPYGRTWTVSPINQLKTNRVILVNGGTGLCNAVYVDDVVQSMVLAAIREKAIGETFLVSGEEPVTWRNFYGAYERILGFESTIAMSSTKARDFSPKMLKGHSTITQIRRGLREHPYILSAILQLPAIARIYRPIWAVTPGLLKKLVRGALLPTPVSTENIPSNFEKPVLPLAEAQISFFHARTRVRIDKARRLLGYQPRFDFAEGMRVTEMWARYANLI